MPFNIDPIAILINLPAVFLALSFHEFAHAFIAYKMGDPTPKYQGRLTLDPMAHVDWIGLIMFALFGFGWAKPVQINPSNFRNRKWGNILVSLAGPAANLLLAVIFFIIQIIIIAFSGLNQSFFLLLAAGVSKASPLLILYSIINRIVFLNIIFAILNLVPIPPFDGYRVVKDLFFRKYASFFWQYERYSLFILLAFILLGLFDYVVLPPAFFIYSNLMQLAILLL